MCAISCLVVYFPRRSRFLCILLSTAWQQQHSIKAPNKMLRKFNKIYFWPHWWCFGWFVILWSVIFWFLGVVLITYLHHSPLIFWLKSLGIAIIWTLLNMICSFQNLVIFCLILRWFASNFTLFLSLVLTWSSFVRWFQ